MNVSEFTKQAVEAGQLDPDAIAADYLARALSSEDPAGWLLVPVRMAVGSSFSSVQKALRGEQQSGRGQAGGDGTGIQGCDDDHGMHGSGDVIAGLTRQGHSESQLWLPSTRRWMDYADATIGQLEEAITYYQGRKEAIKRSIDKFRSAIKDIRAVPGATCLRDVWAAREKQPAA